MTRYDYRLGNLNNDFSQRRDVREAVKWQNVLTVAHSLNCTPKTFTVRTRNEKSPIEKREKNHRPVLCYHTLTSSELQSVMSLGWNVSQNRRIGRRYRCSSDGLLGVRQRFQRELRRHRSIYSGRRHGKSSVLCFHFFWPSNHILIHPSVFRGYTWCTTTRPPCTHRPSTTSCQITRK